VVNTHLSFPHNALDRINQLNQMVHLTESLNKYAIEHGLKDGECLLYDNHNVFDDSDDGDDDDDDYVVDDDYDDSDRVDGDNDDDNNSKIKLLYLLTISLTTHVC